MKSVLALAATVGAVAGSTLHARHEQFHKRLPHGGEAAVPSYFQPECCQNIVTVTVYGTMSASPVEELPTPIVTTCPTPGTYTVPEKTVTVQSTHTVVVYASQSLTPGHNKYGGCTTSVSGPSTVTCSYAVETDVITSTEYVCPSAGEYTIAPSETDCQTSTVVVYPVPATYTPGTYTRDAKTITATVTDYVYVCPFEEDTTTIESTHTVTVTAKKTTAVATVTATGTPPPEQQQQQQQPPAPEKQAENPPPQKEEPKPDTSAISPNGNQWAMTYTPYTQSGQCKTADEVDVDIALIASKGFTAVRLYATDCSGLANVGGSCKKHNLKIIIGVFIDGSGIAGAGKQVDDIVAWGQGGMWEIVELIVVGNEAIFNGHAGAGDLAGFITECKGKFSGAGYSGPVTTTEPLGTLQQSGGSLCAVIDVVAANIQPFFNADVQAAGAGDFVAGQLELVGKVCPGKTAYNLECGWPKAGSANGAAQPGGDQQAAAIKDIVAKAGKNTVFFSFQDDSWKAEGQFGVEQSFGCIDHF